MLRIGIIGAGHFAKAHIHALEQFKDRARVVLVARRDLSVGLPEAAAIGADLVSPDELIASPSVDAVVVCATNDLHRRFSEAALRAGKHVFCEKPLALTLEDAEAVLAASKASGKVLMVGHLARYITAYMKVAGILAEGRLGAPRVASVCRMHLGAGSGRSWRMDGEIGGGVVFDLLIHDLDLLTWYLGKPVSVVARGHRHAQGGYDYLAAIVTYNNGVTAVAEGGFILRPPAGLRSTFRLVCERGQLEVDTDDQDTPIRVTYEGEPMQRIAASMKDIREEGLTREYAEFLDTIEGRPHGVLRPEDAVTAVACAYNAVRAADTGETVFF